MITIVDLAIYVTGPGSLDSGPLDAPDALGTYGIPRLELLPDHVTQIHRQIDRWIRLD